MIIGIIKHLREKMSHFSLLQFYGVIFFIINYLSFDQSKVKALQLIFCERTN